MASLCIFCKIATQDEVAVCPQCGQNMTINKADSRSFLERGFSCLSDVSGNQPVHPSSLLSQMQRNEKQRTLYDEKFNHSYAQLHPSGESETSFLSSSLQERSLQNKSTVLTSENTVKSNFADMLHHQSEQEEGNIQIRGFSLKDAPRSVKPDNSVLVKEKGNGRAVRPKKYNRTNHHRLRLRNHTNPFSRIVVRRIIIIVLILAAILIIREIAIRVWEQRDYIFSEIIRYAIFIVFIVYVVKNLIIGLFRGGKKESTKR